MSSSLTSWLISIGSSNILRYEAINSKAVHLAHPLKSGGWPVYFQPNVQSIEDFHSILTTKTE